MANAELRSIARQWGVPLWAVAERLGISERTMSRRLQSELPQEEAQIIKDVIRDLVQEREEL